MNLSQVAEGIGACNDRLEQLVSDIAYAGDEAAHAEAEYKSSFAKARLLARDQADRAGRKITTDEAEDRAVVATVDERLRHLLAANSLTVCRESLRATQTRMDGLRTLSTSFRAAGG